MKYPAIILIFLFFAIAICSFAYCEEAYVQEWAPYSGVENLSLKDNVLELHSTSSMPLLTTKGDLLINASRLKVLEIKMKSDKSYMTGRMFFRRIGDPGFNYFNSFEFQTGLNNMYHSYLVDLGRNQNWFGTVTQIMFSPINGEGSVEIENVRFLEPSLLFSVGTFWQEFFTFERPAPRTINFIYGPRINGISVNVYVYWLMIAMAALIISFYWLKHNDIKDVIAVAPTKLLLLCLTFWVLLDARTIFDQLRTGITDYQIFAGKSLEEKQALSTNASYYDFYYYLKSCGEKVPSGSSYSLVVPSGFFYFIDKSRYFLYPTYERTIEAQYVLVYDPQNMVKAQDIPAKDHKKYADFGNNRYILKRTVIL